MRRASICEPWNPLRTADHCGSMSRLGSAFRGLLGQAAPGAGQLDEKIAVMLRLGLLRHPNTLRCPLAELLQQHQRPPRPHFDEAIPPLEKSSTACEPMP